MEIHVSMKHGLDQRLARSISTVNTIGDVEVIGKEVILTEVDPDDIPTDIRRVGKHIDYIDRIYKQVNVPGVAQDVIEGRAHIVNGQVVYGKRYKTIREGIEAQIGKLTDEQFSSIMHATTQDIKFNRMFFKSFTNMDELIKIAALCAQALRRCG